MRLESWSSYVWPPRILCPSFPWWAFQFVPLTWGKEPKCLSSVTFWDSFFLADWFLGFCEGQLGGKKLGRKTKEDRGEAKGGRNFRARGDCRGARNGSSCSIWEQQMGFKESSELCVYFIVLKKQNWRLELFWNCWTVFVSGLSQETETTLNILTERI